MKIGEARKIYSPYLDELWQQKQALSQILKEEEERGMDAAPRYDRVEISGKLEKAEKEYGRVQAFMEHLQLRESLIHNAQAAKEQGEAMAEEMENMFKCIETARRIAHGDKVPPQDEKKLMEYNKELYMAAKNMALLSAQKKREEHDSLWEEEEPEEPADLQQAVENAGTGAEPPVLSPIEKLPEPQAGGEG